MEEGIQIKKNIWIDYLRVISTFAVIMIHVSAVGVISLDIESRSWIVANFYDSISRFCVPIFFMISGALLLQKDYGLKPFFIKRVTRILPPFIFWSFVYFFLNNSDFLLNRFEFVTFLEKLTRSFLYGSKYHLWFVYALIGMYLFVPILRNWIKNSPVSYMQYFLLIWLFSNLYRIPNMETYLPKVDMSNFSGFLGFMVLGYYIFRGKFLYKYVYLALFVVCSIITFLGTHYFSINKGVFVDYFYDYLSLNTILAATSLFLFFKNSNINIKGLDSVIIVLSKYSFGIYLVHALVLDLLGEFTIDMYTIDPVFSIPMTSILCLIISFVIVVLVNKIPFGKYISG
jgi:surface polysaccharide O-acyltransferase-like enzyme